MRLDEKLNDALAEQLGKNVSSSSITRGWNYYKNGNVQRVEVTLHDTLTGVVRGGDLYAVVLDAEHFRYSTCTCSFMGYCKHMVAVYFYYCGELEKGREEAEQAYFRMIGLKPASALVPFEKDEAGPHVPNHPDRSGTPGQWLNWMESEYGETWMKCRHSLHALQPVLSGLKGLSKDWPKPLQNLHWSAAILFVLEQAERAILTVDSFSRYYHEMSFTRMAEPWVDHVHTLTSELNPGEMDEEQLAWCDFLASLAKRRAAMTEKQLFEWTRLYLHYCEKLSVMREWYERELSSLLAELELAEEDGREKSFLCAAIGLLYFFDGDDSRSIHYFSSSSFEKNQRLIYPCATARMLEGDWEKAERWMSFLYERVYNNRNARNIGPFMMLCRRADMDRPELPVWQRYMTELLPYSYTELSEHLLAIKRYEEWADLQLFMSMKPEEIDAAELRETVKAAPQALLPLYHQSIEAAIGSRNRQSYRLAVKQLKKLERLYKSTKEIDRWESYLTELVSKYQRLRALQEELWKGKIVT